MRWIIQSSLYLPPASSRWRVSSCEAWSPSARSRSSCCRRCSSPRCPSCCGTPDPPAGPGPPRPGQGKHEFWTVRGQYYVPWWRWASWSSRPSSLSCIPGRDWGCPPGAAPGSRDPPCWSLISRVRYQFLFQQGRPRLRPAALLGAPGMCSAVNQAQTLDISQAWNTDRVMLARANQSTSRGASGQSEAVTTRGLTNKILHEPVPSFAGGCGLEPFCLLAVWIVGCLDTNTGSKKLI